MDGGRKNVKQRDTSTLNRRRLLTPQEVRGMEDALTPRPSTSAGVTRPSINLPQNQSSKTRPKTASKKSVCSNPPCASRHSKDPPLSQQDDNQSVDLAHVIKLYGRLEKSGVPEIQVQDANPEIQASYILPTQLNAVPSQTRRSRSVGVSMDPKMLPTFCGTKSGPCASQGVGEETSNAFTSMEDRNQSFVDSASSKDTRQRNGSVPPKRIEVSQGKVPCEGNQGPCSTKVMKPKSQDQSTAAPRIRSTSTPQYRNVVRNTPPPNFTPIEYPRADQSYYQQDPRLPQSFQTQSTPVQAMSPNMERQQYLQSNSNMSPSPNMHRLQIPHSPRYDRSASLVRNPQQSPSGAGSYRQQTPSYIQRDEIASGSNPVPQFTRYAQSPNPPRMMRTPLPSNTFTRRTPDQSTSRQDVPEYGYPLTNYAPVQRSVPSVKYQRPTARRVSPNRQYIAVPQMEQQPVYSRGIPPVEGNMQGFVQRTPLRRQIAKPVMQGYGQQESSPRLLRREPELRSTNLRDASLSRQQQLAQSNVTARRGYVGTGTPHKIFSKPQSSITKKAFRVPPSDQQFTGSLATRNEIPRPAALPVRPAAMRRPQPPARVTQLQKPSQLPSRQTGIIPKISPKTSSTVRPPQNIEADLGQSFQEFVSRDADVSMQDIDEFNQSKWKKIQEKTPNLDAATRAMQSAAKKKTLEKKAAIASIRKRQEEAKVKHETQRAKAAKISEAKKIAKSLGSALTREEIMALVREENKDIEAAANTGEGLTTGQAPKDINSRAKILKMKGTVRPPPGKKSVLRKAKVDKEPSEPRMMTAEESLPTVGLEDPKKIASIMITLDPAMEKKSPVEKSIAGKGTPSSVVKLAISGQLESMDNSIAMMSLERGSPVEPTPSTSSYQPTGTIQTEVVKKLFSPGKESDIDHEKLANLEEMTEYTEKQFEIQDLSRFGDSEYEHSLLELEEALDILSGASIKVASVIHQELSRSSTVEPIITIHFDQKIHIQCPTFQADPDAPSCDICTPGATKTILKVQLRGSQPPSWFPGFLTVLPQSNPSRFTLSRTSSLPMAQAWKATEPEYYPNESQILV